MWSKREHEAFAELRKIGEAKLLVRRTLGFPRIDGKGWKGRQPKAAQAEIAAMNQRVDRCLDVIIGGK